ncbi:Uncharacterised protein [Serratia marcescens]|nr:Uncharacterised protein [Serratia marcescens]CVG05313.1 Uncharacterised protein [Serratia marcescens]
MTTCWGTGGVLLQELNHSGRHRTIPTFTAFKCITQFPLVDFLALA